MNGSNGSHSNTGKNSVSFWLPSLPGSVNAVYALGTSIRSDKLIWDLKPEWKAWRSDMFPHIKRLTVAATSLIKVDRCYFHSWFYANGNWRKMDVTNCDKLLFDLISKKIEVDDCRFKSGCLHSRNSKLFHRVHVTLSEITQSEWEKWQ